MGKLLDTIHSPADIKSFTVPELEALAQEIREQLILVLSKTGGHLGPNLGVVELTLAMHYVFNTPADKFVFDVSHQAYIHKLLTGRRERFRTMRQPGGLNGFALRTESDHDCYGAGHAGTALSAALGMAVARDLAGTKENVIAFAGDAAFTNGISFEALNNIAEQTKRLIVVLNDNEWSIDRNVGAIANYLHKIVTNERYTNLHDSAARLLEKLGGKTARQMVRKEQGGPQHSLGGFFRLTHHLPCSLASQLFQQAGRGIVQIGVTLVGDNLVQVIGDRAHIAVDRPLVDVQHHNEALGLMGDIVERLKTYAIGERRIPGVGNHVLFGPG